MFCVTVVVEVLSNTDSDSNGVHAYAVTIVHMCIPKQKKKTVDRAIDLPSNIPCFSGLNIASTRARSILLKLCKAFYTLLIKTTIDEV